jgi:hypothetical protein
MNGKKGMLPILGRIVFMTSTIHKRIRTLGLILSILTGACQANPVTVHLSSPEAGQQIPEGMTQEQAATLGSLEQIDDYPLYAMVYQGDYYQGPSLEGTSGVMTEKEGWACSLFAVFGNPEDMLFGRNFDWDFSPGLLLFTDPEDGYASVSMVDIAYLGFNGSKAFGITDLPLEERAGLLEAPFIPFDGMNEAGLVVGMAAVPGGGMDIDPDKETIDSVMVIRLILDQAATIEQAVEIIKSVNIDMGGNYLHYLIAEESGRSALIEFSKGELFIHFNTEDWQPATNFLLSEAGGNPRSQCGRYDLISGQLEENKGVISANQAIRLLERVAQEHTQWSVIYRTTVREIQIVMGGEYEKVYSFDFE